MINFVGDVRCFNISKIKSFKSILAYARFKYPANPYWCIDTDTNLCYCFSNEDDCHKFESL